jgi:hypothetical protein
VLLLLALVFQKKWAGVDEPTGRIIYQGAYYHAMNRGLSRGNIFLEDKDRERFLELLDENLTANISTDVLPYLQGRPWCGSEGVNRPA